LGWDVRVVKVIVGKVKPLEVNKVEKATGGVNRTKQTAAIEVKANYMTCVLIALHPIPRAAITIVSFYCPRGNLRISQRIITRSRLVYDKAFLELQLGRAVVMMAQGLHGRRKKVNVRCNCESKKRKRESDKPIMS
jgi:hypothetical protein